MSQSTTASALAREAVHEVEPTSVKDGTTPEPVLITEQEVLFSTRVALLVRRASDPHRLIDAIRVAAGSLRPPPPRRHYPKDTGYLEGARMAREMDRL
ncbi:hypothetical protein [Mycobacterium sp.]|uniref:hypothetical protein n=1 Tax=Mycobacterium sp. TaxID=1785 RepID=UPI003BAFD3E1